MRIAVPSNSRTGWIDDVVERLWLRAVTAPKPLPREFERRFSTPSWRISSSAMLVCTSGDFRARKPRRIVMAHAVLTADPMSKNHDRSLATELSAGTLELEPELKSSLCGVVGPDISLTTLVARWKEIRSRLPEMDAVRVEAAIRRHWRRA